MDGTPYRFIAPLGRGGMGDVVEAEHVALGKRVVVKLLQERHASRADYVDRMRIEAQALAKITHPNLVQVTDFGQTAEGRTFLVMERLYGRDLRDELAQRRFFPVAEAIDVVRQTLAGLAAAHDAGVVHRDIKLDNLFLCDAPEGARRLVKVLDFGVAKVVSVTGESTPLPLAFPTAEGIAMGTPRFFSPEQARGKPVDGRADLYAVGMVLYTLLAGRGPFDHITTLLDLARAHAFQVPEPPSRHATQALPAGLDAIVMKALAKEPAERYATARTFAAELERVADGLSASNIRPRWDTTDVMPTAPIAQNRAPEVVDDEPATMRVDVLPRGALPKAMPDDDDDAPDTPTRRLERPMPFMRTQRKSAIPPLPLPAPRALPLPAPTPPPMPEAKPPATISEPPKTLENIPQPFSEPPTLPRLDAISTSQPAAKPDEASSLPPDPILDATLTSAIRAPKPPSDAGSLPPDPILDATFPSGPREEPAAARIPSEHPSAPTRSGSERPAATGSERPTSSGGTGRADRISALPGRNPDRPSIVPGGRDRISVLPGRTDRTSALPTRPERISALPTRPERTSNIPPRPAEPAAAPERRSGIPAAAPLHPPAPIPEEQIAAPPPGGVRPLRAPVPWRRRPAAGSTSGAARSATATQQNKPAEVEKGKQQTTMLMIVALLAVVAAGFLVALRVLR
nr:serine/threonine protein kinase [Polyangium spumosum]